MHRYGPRWYNRSPYTGRAPRSLDEIDWHLGAMFDPEPGLLRRLLVWICGH